MMASWCCNYHRHARVACAIRWPPARRSSPRPEPSSPNAARTRSACRRLPTRAGVNRTTAYTHFRTRDDLTGAVLAEVADEVSRMLTGDARPGERLGRMVHFFVDHSEIS